MKRALICWLGLMLGSASAQTPLDINRNLLESWRACVELRYLLSPNRTVPFGSIEEAFRECATEEQLFVAALSLSMGTQQNKDRALFDHYRAKLELKNKLADESFREMAKQLGKPQ